MDEDKAEVMPNIDYIYSAVIADSEALEEAKMTLEIIKKTDPGVYDEMINDTLSMIRKALSSSILSVVDRMVKVEVEAEREAIAKMIEDAPPLVDFAKNEHDGCLICGFTPKLFAFTIRERGAP